MGKVLLIDAVQKDPNLALMQISAYHKDKGDSVSLNTPNDPDIVYISCIFTKNREHALGRAKFYPDARIHIGGSGINYEWLPNKMQRMKPDYDLYPNIDYSLGFTTRGCIRKCEFCIVREKEGYLKRWQHPREFHDDRFKIINLLDNNILADKIWFMETSEWIIENNLKVIEHGMDIRLLDRDITNQLARMRFPKGMKFAFDSTADEKAVRRGVALFKDVGIDVRRKVQFYVLVGYNTTEEEDLYRCRLLKELGTKGFVMQYKRTEWTSRLAWWANNNRVFWSCDIEDVDRSKYR